MEFDRDAMMNLGNKNKDKNKEKNKDKNKDKN